MLSTRKKRPPEPPDEGEGDAAPPQSGKPGATPPSDAKNLEAERLEQALAEERQHSATLRASVEDLRFKMTILEKSYAKQLADARARAEGAEKGLAEEKARLQGIDGNHENTLKVLAETRAQLAQAIAERDLLRKQPGSAPGRRSEPGAAPVATAYHDHPPAPTPENELTINTLMADLTRVAEERRAAGSRPKPETPVEEPPAEDMIPADLVFPKKRDSKDDKED